jgi:5-(carboxyamino)imidazole ribonucleotide mutase
MTKPLVGIIMGSDSDLPVMVQAAEVLEELKVPFEINVVSAHRTPELMIEYAVTATKKGLKVIIAAAGGAAHLPGMVAASTHLPVIGVPIKQKSLNGADSLYSIVQMPPGVPVAAMAIDGARNAGILAAQIIGTSDPTISKRLIQFKKDLIKKVEGMREKLVKVGYKERAQQIKEGKR